MLPITWVCSALKELGTDYDPVKAVVYLRAGESVAT